MIAELARATSAEPSGGAVRNLRAALLSELDRVGTTVGLIDEFDFPEALRLTWAHSIQVEEFRGRGDQRLQSALLVRVFMGAAYWEQTLKGEPA